MVTALILILPIVAIGLLFLYSYKTGKGRNVIALVCGIVGTVMGMFAGGFMVYNLLESAIINYQTNASYLLVVWQFLVALLMLFLSIAFIFTCWRCALYLFHEDDLDNEEERPQTDGDEVTREAEYASQDEGDLPPLSP